MPGVIQRAARWGGKSFWQMQNGGVGLNDVCCVNLVDQGAFNDTVLTRLVVSAIAVYAPAAQTPGTFTTMRWAVLQGPGDCAPVVLAGISPLGPSCTLATFGGMNGESGGSTVPAAVILPSSSGIDVVAEGFFTDQEPLAITWPEDADAPGAVILRAGKVAQLVIFGGWASPQQSPNLPTVIYVNASIHGGPPRRVVTNAGRGLPMQSYDERS
jgi:hypothetical protein